MKKMIEFARSLHKKRKAIPDSQPVKASVKFRHDLSTEELIRQHVAAALNQRLTQIEEESVEEMFDFDIDSDMPDFISRYETQPMHEEYPRDRPSIEPTQDDSQNPDSGSPPSGTSQGDLSPTQTAS